MVSPNKIHRSEQNPANAESFIPITMMENVVATALYEKGRVNEFGVVQPLEIERQQHDSSRWIIGRGPTLPSHFTYDVVPPPQLINGRGYITEENDMTVRSRVRWDPEKVLYDTLAQRRHMTLSPSDVRGLQADHDSLSNALVQSGKFSLVLGEELTDALHIKATEEVSPDFEPLRLYIPGGLHAMGITRDMINLHASFARAKVWTPEPMHSPQAFRSDAPIFEVNTFTQLRSTVNALRVLHSIGRISSLSRTHALLGANLPGLPGVYAGQPGKTSFNNEMSELFGQAMYQACLETPLMGNKRILDSAWVRNVAIKTRAYAQDRAEGVGRDTHNHAFVQGQPVAQIMSVLEKN